MSKLLNKPLRTFIIYASAVLLASVPVYFFAVDMIWRQELDENNEIIAERAIYQLQLTDFRIHDADSLLTFWNLIQPNARLEPLPDNKPVPADTSYALYKGHVNPDYKRFKDRFQVLERSFELNGKPWRIIVESNVEETYETVAMIAFITGLFFIILSTGFIYLNRKMSGKIWLPFRDTLDKLKNFRVDEGKVAEFPASGILEFEELNRALEKLMARNIDVFRMQKEFTENASHELQTPLAIIQNKLGLLLQSDSVSREQCQLVEGANKALARAIRINKDLLLLARIANDQFSSEEEIRVSRQVSEMIELLEHEFQRRSVELTPVLDADVMVSANPFLFTTVIQNLMTNALKYCPPGGKITVFTGPGRLLITNSGNKPLNPARLFQRFAIVDEENPSTGIGLALVHSICQQNGWRISYAFEDGAHRFEIIFAGEEGTQNL